MKRNYLGIFEWPYSDLSACLSIVLIFFSVGAQAATVDNEYVAEQVVIAIKEKIKVDGPKERSSLIEDPVKKDLAAMKIEDATINSISDTLRSLLPENIDSANVNTVAGMVNATILTSLQQVVVNSKRFEDIDQKISYLIAAKHPKMLAPYKDVDFLFEDVVGDTFDALANNVPLSVGGLKITKIKITRNFILNDDLEIYLDGRDEPIRYQDLAPISIEAKMQAVERTLGIDPGNSDLVTRIGNAYVKVNNTDWQNDDLRFGVLVATLRKADIIATSVALHAYLGYRRYSPGHPFVWNNFLRRFSVYFAVGTGSSSNNAEVRTPVYSAGIGLDIVKGFVVSAGLSQASYKAQTDQDFTSKATLSFGITLNSDLWKALFNK